MGTWGPGLFSDDTARDVRAAYEELLEAGVPDGVATERILAKFSSALADEDDGPVVWLALASTQHRFGRLDPQVRDRALDVIDRKEGLARWAERGSRLLAERTLELAKLRARLLAGQSERKRVRKRKQVVTTLQIGDVLCYRAKNQLVALLRVAQLLESPREIGPLLKALDFKGKDLPSPNSIRRLRDRRSGDKAKRPRGTPLDPWAYVTFYATVVKEVDYEQAGFWRVANIGPRTDDVAVRDLPHGALAATWLQLAEDIEQNLSSG